MCGLEAHYSNIDTVLSRLRSCCAQFDIDGTHNVWIVKPGAKSRGRGTYKNYLLNFMPLQRLNWRPKCRVDSPATSVFNCLTCLLLWIMR